MSGLFRHKPEAQARGESIHPLRAFRAMTSMLFQYKPEAQARGKVIYPSLALRACLFASLLRSTAIFVLVLLVRLYQACLRPILPAVCRFYPSCSEYFILSVQKYGPFRGAWKGFCRL